MATAYPLAVDVFPPLRESSSTAPLAIATERERTGAGKGPTKTRHRMQHQDFGQAITALQRVVGTTNNTEAASVLGRLQALQDRPDATQALRTDLQATIAELARVSARLGTIEAQAAAQAARITALESQLLTRIQAHNALAARVTAVEGVIAKLPPGLLK